VARWSAEAWKMEEPQPRNRGCVPHRCWSLLTSLFLFLYFHAHLALVELYFLALLLASAVREAD
jgi:hypothetical protein